MPTNPNPNTLLGRIVLWVVPHDSRFFPEEVQGTVRPALIERVMRDATPPPPEPKTWTERIAAGEEITEPAPEIDPGDVQLSFFADGFEPYAPAWDRMFTPRRMGQVRLYSWKEGVVTRDETTKAPGTWHLIPGIPEARWPVEPEVPEADKP